jgi:hypothetical protein
MTSRVSTVSRTVETRALGDMTGGTEADERLVGIAGGRGGRGRSMTSTKIALTCYAARIPRFARALGICVFCDQAEADLG